MARFLKCFFEVEVGYVRSNYWEVSFCKVFGRVGVWHGGREGEGRSGAVTEWVVA